MVKEFTYNGELYKLLDNGQIFKSVDGEWVQICITEIYESCGQLYSNKSVTNDTETQG
jgi:hypothetical protein